MLSLFHKRCHFTRFVVLVGGGRIIVSSFIKSVFVCFWGFFLTASLRRIREFPLSIPWTLHWGENHWPERKWNREKSQQPQREAFTPQTRLWSGMETPFSVQCSTSHHLSYRTTGHKATASFFFKLNLKRYIHTTHADIREFYFWHIKTFSQLTYDIIWPSLLPGLFIKTAWCPADIRTPLRKDSLSSLTFLLLFPLTK